MVFAAEYTTATLAGWVAVALVVGLIVGWLVRPWLVGDRLRNDYEGKLAHERGARSEAESGLESTTRHVGELKSELDIMRGDLARLKAELAVSQSRGADLETQVASLAMEKDAEIARLGAEAGKVSSLEVAIGERDARISALEGDLAARDVEAARSKAVAEAAEAARTRIRGTEQQLETEQQRPQAAEARSAPPPASQAPEPVLPRTEESEVPPVPAGVTPSAPSVVPDTAAVAVPEVTADGEKAQAEPIRNDDLKRIKGIGPVIERQLKAMGFESFLQIANLTAAERAEIGASLGSFANRIERDDWMTSAAQLHEEKYGPGL